MLYIKCSCCIMIEKRNDILSFLFFCKRVCKPGSVLDSHLSMRTVAGALKPPPKSRRAGVAKTRCSFHGVAPDRVYSDGHSRTVGRALISAFPPLPAERRRYISVALFLKSPSAGVTRYPCPAEPGLSSRTAFRLVPAAAQLTHSFIVR